MTSHDAEWVVARQAEMLEVRDRLIVEQAERIAELERTSTRLTRQLARMRQRRRLRRAAGSAGRSAPGVPGNAG